MSAYKKGNKAKMLPFTGSNNFSSVVSRITAIPMTLAASRHFVPVLGLSLIYTLVFGPTVFAIISASQYMEMDPRSIMNAIEGLTTGPVFYNMNNQYHSQFYGWTFFSLNFILVMVAKLFGFASEIYINFIVRSVMFAIGLGLVLQAYYLAQIFFSRIWAFVLTMLFMTNPVTAKFFFFIHPESLGLLLQLVAIGLFISIYKSLPEFAERKFLLAVAMLSLSALCKQSFFISGVFVYISFFIISISSAGQNSDFRSWQNLGKLTLKSCAVGLVILFVIHPSAIIDIDHFSESTVKFVI